MSSITRIRWVLALTATMLVAVVPVANAYVDPGSTSLIFSWIVAGFAAASMTLRIFWSRIRRFFSDGNGGDDPTDGPQDGQPTRTEVGADGE